MAAPVVAKAQPVTGLYVGAGAGLNFMQDEFIKHSPALGNPKLTEHFSQPGLASESSIGYGFGNGLRLELEGDYNYSHIRKVTGTRFPTAAGGELQEYGVMANALYDFDIGIPYMYPYVGVGVGEQWLHQTNFHDYGIRTPRRFDTNDTQGNFAYQGIIGASFPVPYMPGLSLTAEYRFLGVLDPQPAYHSDTFASNHAYRGRMGRGNLDFYNAFDHQVLLGVRYAFGVAPPPPPPAPVPTVTPAPAPARTYLVFFDWDRADLTDRARQIIAEAAQASTRVQTTRIEVNGYTDRSGKPSYNVRLSWRRARNVAAELVRDGVPRNIIIMRGYGESNPLVPTAPGVREPQNRRVEIILR